MTDEIQTRPFDAKELQSCYHCGKGIMHNGDLTFYEVQVGQCIVDMAAVREQAGLELAFGAVGSVLASTNLVAYRLPPRKLLICLPCVMRPITPAVVVEGEG